MKRRARRAALHAAVVPAAAFLTLSIALGAWVPQGPAPVRDGQIENVVPDDQISGAIHVVAPHPTDADTLYVGTVNGGVWKTTNATDARPLWRPLTDGFPGSIGALEFDPTDGSHLTLVAARGQFSSFYLAGPLTGLLRTTDGGASWAELSDPLLVGRSFTGVAARGATLVVSASPQFGGGPGGLFRSTNTGAGWTQLDGDGGSGLPLAVVGYTDLVGDPGSPSRLYTASREQAIFRSDDTGATWADVSASDATLSGVMVSADNVELAVFATGRLWVRASVGGQPAYIGYTDDPTSVSPTWTRMDLPLTPEDIAGVGDASNTTPIVISTASGPVTDASNTAPIAITSAGHGLSTDGVVEIAGVLGNVDANGTWFITVLDADTFELQGSVGSGAYAGGGSWTQQHQLASGSQVRVAGVTGNTAANGLFTISALDSFTFELDSSAGNGGYTGGGTYAGVQGLNPTGRPGSQGFLHSSIVADPSDADLVYVGGDAQPGGFPNFIGAENYSGRLFRGDASVPATGEVPSPQWEHLTHLAVPDTPGGGTAGNSAPHADSREMAFDAAGDLLETSDGGIYRRTSPQDNTGDWFSINGSLQVTELHDIAYDTLSNVISGGTQDNGTVEQQIPPGFEWANVLTGDGGDVAADATSTPGFSVRYLSAQFLLAFARDTYAASGAFDNRVFPALDIVDGSEPFPQFTTPIELNRVDPTRMIIGTYNHVYESLDQGDTLTTVDPFDPMFPTVGTGANWDALAYGGFDGAVANPDVIYFGSGGDVWVRETPAPDPPVLTCHTGGLTVRDLVLQPDDWHTVYVADDASVTRLTGAGTTCTDVTGDIATAYVTYDLNRIEYVAGAPDRIAVSGTFDGSSDVLVMDVSVPGVWTPLGPGLPDTVVGELDYDPADGILVAGTMGRGAWVFDVTCAPGAETPWYRDVDGDGFGDPQFGVSACAMPPGFVADGSDCNDGDADVWAVPGEATDLLLSHAGGVGGTTTLTWSAPALAGGVPLYDTVGSAATSSFLPPDSFCVEPGGADLSSTDSSAVGAGDLRAYLVRARTSCGVGSAGTDYPGGNERSVSCGGP